METLDTNPLFERRFPFAPPPSATFVEVSAAPEGFSAGRVLSPGPHFVVFEVARGGAAFVCKRLSTRWLRDESAWAGLRAEARLLETLAGMAAPGVETAGEDAHGPYLVMRRVVEPILTTSSANVLPDARPAWLARAARASFDALARLHEARDAAGPLGVVHGDLRPENVAVAEDASSVTFLDYGLATWREAPPRDAGAFRGTLLYAPPEAARGEPLDARADLFSLAASLLEIAGGTPPRAVPNEAALLVRAAEEPIDDWARDAARGLELSAGAALAACVAFDRARRPATARDVLGMLGCRA
jgi:serine/threonine protein kinase